MFGIEVEAIRFSEEGEFFGDLNQRRLIYLTRKNILAQAISLALADRSGRWRSFDKSEKHGEFLIDSSSIKWQLNFLLENERTFENVFRDQNIQPLRLTYEGLVENPAAQVRSIAEYIGMTEIDFSDFDISETVLKPTRTGVNRYYELMTIMTGGEFWGYNIHTIENRHFAVLAGVRVDLLALDAERSPVMFIETDRDALRGRVKAYIINKLADC